ncbi:hypothetical protein J1605_015368 [Eschrichtius robustus]|uniref:Sodium/glucose cotransporter 1 n=1 Tax=Eschrichtius robustus TaxID=9764 RepID=A0AB34GEN1_ESCRO|nr:hypothetical protein J1605_015368 [Eschrichtius robustus]
MSRARPARSSQAAPGLFPGFPAAATPEPHGGRCHYPAARGARPPGRAPLGFPWYGFAWSAQVFTASSALDVLVIVLYFLLVLGIALWAILSSSRGTVEDFFLASRNLAWWQIGAFLFASNIGTGHFMGLAGKGVSSGIAVGAFEWNVVTLPKYLRKRFGGYRIQLLLAILYLFLYIFSKISVEICTGAMFMRLVLGLDVYLATVVLLSVTGIYAITGGFAAAVYTDILHAGVVVLGSVLLMGYDEETEALRTHEHCLRSCPRQEKEELRSRRGDDKLKHFEQQSRVVHHTHPRSVPLSMLFLSS